MIGGHSFAVGLYMTSICIVAVVADGLRAIARAICASATNIFQTSCPLEFTRVYEAR